MHIIENPNSLHITHRYFCNTGLLQRSSACSLLATMGVHLGGEPGYLRSITGNDAEVQGRRG